MKKVLFVALLPFLILLAGCGLSEWWVSTTIDAGEIVLEVFHSAYTARCTSGASTPEQCAKFEYLYKGLVESLRAARLAQTTWLEMKDKTTEEKLVYAVTHMQTFYNQIKALVEAWKPKQVLDQELRDALREGLPADQYAEACRLLEI